MIHANSFFKFFPPPAYLLMPAIGIALSDQYVRYAELKSEGGRPVLDRYGEKAIPDGAVLGGKVQNPEAYKAILTDLREELEVPFVRLALPEQHGYVFKIDVPRVTRSKLRGSVELRIEEHVPIDPREALFDYNPISCTHHDSGGGKTVPIGVSVIERNLVIEYLALFESAGFMPLTCEMEAQAITRALVAPDDCETYMIADIGATRTNLSIVSEGIIYLTWTVSVSGSMLSGAVAKAFGMDIKEARARKEREGLKRGKTGEDMYSVLVPILRVLRDEILKRYEYWKMNAGGHATEKTIQTLLLCGGEANVPDLPEYLEAGLPLRVRKADPWINIALPDEYIPDMPYNHSLRYVTPLGLAMRQPR